MDIEAQAQLTLLKESAVWNSVFADDVRQLQDECKELSSSLRASEIHGGYDTASLSLFRLAWPNISGLFAAVVPLFVAFLQC